jgi:hypothetical protein
VTLSSFFPRRGVAPSLLATTSVAALLLGSLSPASAGQSFTNRSVASISSPQGQATTSIVISGSTVTGAVSNAGTISPGNPGALVIDTSTVGGGIVNSGAISASGAGQVTGVSIGQSTVSRLPVTM